MTRLTLNGVRLAFCHLDQPRAAAEGAAPKYSAVLIVPKDHAQLDELKNAIREAATEKFGAKKPAGLKNPMRDGDEIDAETSERVKGPEFANAYYVSATSKKPVEIIVGKSKAPASDPDHYRSGHYASVKVATFGYDVSGSKGVALGLNSIWLTKRGEPLGGAAEPWAEVEAEDFSGVLQKVAGQAPSDDDIF
ncbi:MAG: hypothetical protein RL194_1040 [Pseudomonadota bacterium]